MLHKNKACYKYFIKKNYEKFMAMSGLFLLLTHISTLSTLIPQAVVASSKWAFS